MFDQIERSVSRILNLEKAEFDFFTSLLRKKTLKKKEMLLRSGEDCRDIYFINSGCLRYYYVVDGEEKTAQFFFEDSWYTDYESFLSGDPAENYVDAIEDSELLCLERDSLQRLYIEIPKFERFGRMAAEGAYLGIKYRTKHLTTLSAEERYLKLLQERPHVYERIPQYYIASYLNIQPESLSRIRKKLATKGGG
ncbi:MAG: Crp/Fnr family transcriptional regulator [Bacteroidota bacterium]|jgi:CRP-like cAMP-binding protein